MLWYNDPDSVDAIRKARLEERTTVRIPKLRAVRTGGDITETAL